MKYFHSINGFCIILLFSLLGCQSVPYTEFINKANPNHLETSLMNDIKDGRLDMPFDQVCLIASGVNTDKKMQTYLTKINRLAARINQETDISKTIEPSARAKILFDWLQKNANEGVYSDCYDFRDTLNLNVGNCLSYAIRFTILCRQFDTNIKNVMIPGHIYNMMTSDGQTNYFEHTHSDGIVRQSDKDNPQSKIMNDEELIAEIFLYKARNANIDMEYETSIKYCQQALLCNPHDNRPIILLLDNYITQKNYNEAFQYLNNYLDHHPTDKESFRKTYTLLKRLCKKEDNKF